MSSVTMLLARFALILTITAIIAQTMDISFQRRKSHGTRALSIDVDEEAVPSRVVGLPSDKKLFDEDDDRQKIEALERLKKALGIGEDGNDEPIDLTNNEPPPQFMIELYNTVTDDEGYTTRENPYGAKIVRSYVEKAPENPASQSYNFKPSGLKYNESIIEAELHLYRKRSSLSTALVHPSILSSPYYVIRVYQIMPDKSPDEPDAHRLLNVHYVGAYASGWQVFNVKQAVISWLSDESPNLGLLVTAATIFGEEVKVNFVRRDNNEKIDNRRPILVLFNDDSRTKDLSNITREVDNTDDDDDKDETKRRNKRHNNYWPGQPEIVPSENYGSGWSNRFHREKKHKNLEKQHRKAHGASSSFVPKQRSLEQTITSMDIYERALLRDRLNAPRRKDVSNKFNDRTKFPSSSLTRTKREIDDDASLIKENDATNDDNRDDDSVSVAITYDGTCARRELYVNFKKIGMPVIAPDGFNAYQCRGHCRSPLSQDQKPTNHATIQSIVHQLNLDKDVREPCCVPVSLASVSMLYYDDKKGHVILKSFTDMAVVSCGCR